MKIVPFNFANHEVRAMTIDGEPWFLAGDVCSILGLANVGQAVASLDEDERSNISSSDVGLAGGRDPIIVSESGLYSLILRSRKPEARAFKRWVTHEVLPTIRKTGSYGQQLALTDDEIVAQALAITSAKVKQLEAKVEEDAPKVEYVDQYVAPDDDVVQFRIAAQQLGIGEVALRKLLSDAKWAYRANLGRRWSEKEQRMIDFFEWRPYSHHADKFQLRPQHNAPRHHNGQVRQTLYIKSVALPKIADLIEYGDADEQLIDEVA